MATFAVSQASGFVGGPIFPSLFIGGTAGVLVHQVIPGVPLGLAFTCLLAAVPGALAPAPFSMVLMAAFLTQVGALQTAPILIAVVTAFLTMEAVKYLLASRRQAREPRRNQQLRLEGARDPGPPHASAAWHGAHPQRMVTRRRPAGRRRLRPHHRRVRRLTHPRLVHRHRAAMMARWQLRSMPSGGRSRPRG